MTVVFDSNIWVSALQFGGVPLAAIRMAYIRNSIASCEPIEAEVSRVLQAKFGWNPKQVANVINAFLDTGSRVQITGSITNICRDKNDDMMVECALIARAQVIVSGDKDLLSLGSYSGISIVTAADYLRPYKA